MLDAGLCTLRDLKERLPGGEPALDLDDVCDLNEVLMVRAENERRSRKAAEKMSRKRKK